MEAAYILRRKNGQSLYLSPYVDPTTADKWDEGKPIRWFASTGLTTQEKDTALFIIYKQIERGVDRWIQDKRYIPRLLISAFVFLVLYFFFSLAVRDPIPVIDELIIGLIGALLTANYLAKRDKKGDLAMKRKMLLKQNASRAEHEIESKLTSYEKFLDECGSLEGIDLADRISQLDDRKLPNLTNKNEKVDTLLHSHVKINEKFLDQRFSEYKKLKLKGKLDESFSAKLVKLGVQGDLDLPLLALLVTTMK
ncbi:MAG: hypothetical protein ACOXZZ_07290 [Sphaerochaetaceae bacterium]|jgi:hypothetical protein